MLERLGHNLRYSLKYRIAGIIFILEAIRMTSVLGATLSYSMQNAQQQRAATVKVMLNLLGDLSRIALLTSVYGELQAHIKQVVDDPYIETVLLAEDNEDNQHYISILLRTTGADFAIAQDGQAAVQMAKQIKRTLFLKL